MRNIILVLLLLKIANPLIAQENLLQAASDLSMEARMNNGFIRPVNIEGTPYAKEDSSLGVFYQRNIKPIKAWAKLNYYFNNFEFVSNGKKNILDASIIDSVIVDKETFVFKNISVNGNNSSRAVKVIGKQGGNSIYFFKSVEFQSEVKPGGYIDPKPARYLWVDPVYLFEKGDKIIPLNNFKMLIASFPNNEDQIKKFIKDNKIHKDNPDELRKLLTFISQF